MTGRFGLLPPVLHVISERVTTVNWNSVIISFVISVSIQYMNGNRHTCCQIADGVLQVF